MNIVAYYINMEFGYHIMSTLASLYNASVNQLLVPQQHLVWIMCISLLYSCSLWEVTGGTNSVPMSPLSMMRR